jgi:hypothetical protein
MTVAGAVAFIFTTFAIDYDVIIKQEGGGSVKFS